MAFSASPISHSVAQSATLTAIPAAGSVDSSGADLAVVALDWYTALSATLSTIGDNVGNTYRARTGRTGDSGQLQLFDAKNITPSASHAIALTWSNGNVFGTGLFVTFSGSDLTEPFDKESGGAHGVSGSTPLTSTTPTNADSLCIACEGMGASGGSFTNATIDSGTITDQTDRTGNLAGVMAYLVQSGGPSAYAPTFTNTGGTTVLLDAMAIYKPATGGGGGSVFNPYFYRQHIARMAA